MLDIVVLKRSPSSRADQQAQFLRERMQEYKVAALHAKKKGDLELAKKYIRLAKVIFSYYNSLNTTNGGIFAGLQYLLGF